MRTSNGGRDRDMAATIRSAPDGRLECISTELAQKCMHSGRSTGARVDKRGLLLVAPSGMAAGVALMAARELWINARRELASGVDPGAKRLLARGVRSAFSHEH